MFHCEVLTNKQISYTHILLRGTCFQNVLRPYFTIIVTLQKNYSHFNTIGNEIESKSSDIEGYDVEKRRTISM